MLSYAGRNRTTINFLKTIYFDTPEWTPAAIGLLPATWMKYRGRLEELVLSHPKIWPGYKKGQTDFDFTKMHNPLYELGRFTDCWGTTWENIHRGMDAQPVVEPLADWAAFDQWKKRLPDPMKDGELGPRPDWDRVAKAMADEKAKGGVAWGGVYGSGLMHGFFFMRLYYLRGFENLMVDLATDDPRIHELSRIVTDYAAAIVRKNIELGCEMVGLAEDLGMQAALPISPAMWRKFVKPAYEATAGQARDRGLPAALHSDGHILEIIPDLIETGVRLLNPQIRANGLEGLRKYAKGKVALNQDLDRQLFPFATRGQIEQHIGEVFDGLYMRKGGLMLLAECGPDVSLENIDAIACTLEKLCGIPEPEKA